MITHIKRLIIISRPLFCVPISSIYIGGWLLASRSWTPSTSLFLLFSLLPMGTIVFGINDISDMDSDSRNQRKGKIEGAVIIKKEMAALIRTITVLAAIYLAYSFWSGYYLSGLMITGIILFSLAYSLKPVRLKSIPFLDSLSNGFWVLFVFLLGYYSSQKGWSVAAPSWRTSLLVVLTVSAIHTLTTLFDLEVDRAAGDRTTGTLLGTRKTALLALIMFAVCLMAAKPPNVFVSCYYLLCCLFCTVMYAVPSAQLIHKLTYATIMMAPLVAAGVAVFGF